MRFGPIKITYLNKPDKSDPEDRFRVWAICFGPYFFKLTWCTEMFTVGNINKPPRLPSEERTWPLPHWMKEARKCPK